jgi:hypothetical protein
VSSYLAYTWGPAGVRLPATIVGAVLMAGGVVLFVPPTRTWALTSSDINAHKIEVLARPQIFEVRPDTVIIGKTQELFLVGSHLAPDARLPGG